MRSIQRLLGIADVVGLWPAVRAVFETRAGPRAPSGAHARGRSGRGCISLVIEDAVAGLQPNHALITLRVLATHRRRDQGAMRPSASAAAARVRATSERAAADAASASSRAE